MFFFTDQASFAGSKLVSRTKWPVSRNTKLVSYVKRSVSRNTKLVSHGKWYISRNTKLAKQTGFFRVKRNQFFMKISRITKRKNSSDNPSWFPCDSRSNGQSTVGAKIIARVAKKTCFTRTTVTFFLENILLSFKKQCIEDIQDYIRNAKHCTYKPPISFQNAPKCTHFSKNFILWLTPNN